MDARTGSRVAAGLELSAVRIIPIIPPRFLAQFTRAGCCCREPRCPDATTSLRSSTGEALISSSASDEMALESREIKGSFFTHHLVSGLRGAADTSGDGRVTLAEAYEYVFKRTVTATAATTIGPQHPGYTYRLSGEGELVLTDLNVRTARLTIPTGLDRVLIIDRRSERVLAEVGPGGASSLALPSGDFLVRATVGSA